MKIYDSKSRNKIDFEPLNKGEIKMYVCGPTVYDLAHLGHGRSAVAFDVIRKYFKYKNYNVTYVSNYTDIDDKMINRAKDEDFIDSDTGDVLVANLADKIIPEYEKDYSALLIDSPDIQPKATDHIDEIIEIISKLEQNDYTYTLEDGVYFDIEKFPAYGEFSAQNLEELKMGARVDVNENKRNPYDFALWKFKKEGEPSWESPWGEGRPGWHIECSAMCFKHLGENFDIHGGGLDLKFPHHECEVAQSLCAFGKDTFAKYWIHNGFINVDNEKMSKSLGNFFTLREIFEKFDPFVVRFMILQTHYRNPINFSDQLLEQAKAGLDRIHDFVRNLKIGYEEMDAKGSGELWGEKFLSDFESYMDNDFDTSGAIGTIYSLINQINSMKQKGELTKDQIDSCEKFLEKINTVFGVILPKTETIESEIEDLIKAREEARKNKNFDEADKIRDDLLKQGIILEDTSEGTIWKKA